MSLAQCWCGAIYKTSEELVKHWADVVKAGESVFGHNKPTEAVSPEP